MDTPDLLLERNARFAESGFDRDLRMMPALRTIVVGCVDPRVDPTAVLGLEPGEVAAVRNVGGRVTPGVRDEIALLRAVTQAAGADLGPGWNLVVLHHTDCGITRLADRPDLLAGFLGVDEAAVSSLAVGDPAAAVAIDTAVLAGDDRFPGTTVSGFVYDVTTGRIDRVA